MPELHLFDFRFEKTLTGSLLSCRVKGDSIDQVLRYEISGSDVEIEAPETADWALVGLLYPAMMRRTSLRIDAPVSKGLLFAARNDIQSLLISFRQNLRNIDISADWVLREEGNLKRTGTGFSAGVDSFATLAIYSNKDAPETVSDLTIFDVGAFGRKFTPEYSKVVDRNISRLRKYATSSGKGWFVAKSNLGEFFNGLPKASFQKTHTLRNASAALTLQSHLSNYLYSSTYQYSDINKRKDDMAYIDPILLPLLSYGDMHFQSAGAGLSRIEKTRIVAEFSDAYDALDVCVASADKRGDRTNCSMCWKCRRTLLTLDAIDRLALFHKSFDLDLYQSTRKKAVREIRILAAAGKPMEREVSDLISGTAMDTGLGPAGYAKALKLRFKDYIKSNA